MTNSSVIIYCIIGFSSLINMLLFVITILLIKFLKEDREIIRAKSSEEYNNDKMRKTKMQDSKEYKVLKTKIERLETDNTVLRKGRFHK